MLVKMLTKCFGDNKKPSPYSSSLALMGLTAGKGVVSYYVNPLRKLGMQSQKNLICVWPMKRL